MSRIRVTNIMLSDEPQPFTKPLTMSIFFESSAGLSWPVEWRVVYVGSAESEDFDQVLENITIPVGEPGPMCFDLEVEPPDARLIPSPGDLLGPSVLMVAALYHGLEFFRCSYFVYNNYFEDFEAELAEDPVDVAKVVRTVLVSQPRIRLTEIDWDVERTLNLAAQIALADQRDMVQVREETQQLFASFKDPFGPDENSFLANRSFFPKESEN